MRPRLPAVALVTLACGVLGLFAGAARADVARTLVVRGRVLAADGSPVGGVRVSARGSSTIVAQTDDRGRFTVSAPIGTAASLRREPFTLEVRAEQGGRRLPLASGAPALGIEITVVPASGHVRVRSNAQAATTAIASTFAQSGLATAWVEVDFGGAVRPTGAMTLAVVDEVDPSGRIVAVTPRTGAPPSPARISEPPARAPVPPPPPARPADNSTRPARLPDTAGHAPPPVRQPDTPARTRPPVRAVAPADTHAAAPRVAAPTPPPRAAGPALVPAPVPTRTSAPPASPRNPAPAPAQAAAGTPASPAAPLRAGALPATPAPAPALATPASDSTLARIAAPKAGTTRAAAAARRRSRHATRPASAGGVVAGGVVDAPAGAGTTAPAPARPSDVRIVPIESFARPAPPPAEADTCACRVRGTVEVDWDRPLERDFQVELSLEGPAIQRGAVQMFIGSPREFRFGPLPCGVYRLVVRPQGRIRYTVAHGDSVVRVRCNGLSQVRVVLEPHGR